MELTINGKNIDITTRLRNYVEKKTERLDRYMPNLEEVRVDLSTQKARNALERQVAQVTIRDRRGTMLRAEEQNHDMFAAIDAVVDKLYRQIRRYRGQKRKRRTAAAPQVDDMAYLGEPLPIAEEGTEDEGAIVRSKRFALNPMNSDEAVEQMELLGHDFFVFFNSEEEAINVLYRRHDGNYGLLQPEFD
ncbi:MAG: ribosome-associated translation inhibitor RaiA [Chloroflexota bacterium]